MVCPRPSNVPLKLPPAPGMTTDPVVYTVGVPLAVPSDVAKRLVASAESPLGLMFAS